jgi:hypothetical protein
VVLSLFMMRLVMVDGLFMIMLMMVYDLFMMLVMLQACCEVGITTYSKHCFNFTTSSVFWVFCTPICSPSVQRSAV